MKKTIYLTIIFLITFFVLSCNVNAAKKLTCIYEKGNLFGQKPIKLTQSENGDYSLYLNTKGNDDENDSNWGILFENQKDNNGEFEGKKSKITFNFTIDQYYYKSNGTIQEFPRYWDEKNNELVECPYCLDYKNNKYTFKDGYDSKNKVTSNSCPSGYTKLTGNSITSTKENQDWTAECVYGTENQITISFNDEYINIKDEAVNNAVGKNVDISETKQVTFPDTTFKEIRHGIKNNITLSSMLSTFKSQNSCPTVIYKGYRETNSNAVTTGNTICYALIRSDACGNAQIYTINDGLTKINKQKKEEKEKKEYKCGLFGQDTINFINDIMKWFRIIAPILLICFGILDFAKATFSGKEDEMQKNRDKFIKRIIAAILLFLVPIFVNLVLTLANDVWDWISPETCIK